MSTARSPLRANANASRPAHTPLLSVCTTQTICPAAPRAKAAVTACTQRQLHRSASPPDGESRAADAVRRVGAALLRLR